MSHHTDSVEYNYDLDMGNDPGTSSTGDIDYNYEYTTTDWDSGSDFSWDTETSFNFDYDFSALPDITGGGDLTGLDMGTGGGDWMRDLIPNLNVGALERQLNDLDLDPNFQTPDGDQISRLAGISAGGADAELLSTLTHKELAAYKVATNIDLKQQELSNAQEARQTLNPLTWNVQTWISLLGLGYGIYAAEERKDAYERANDPTRMGTNAAQQQIAYRTAMNAAGMGTTSGGGSSSSGGGAAVPVGLDGPRGGGGGVCPRIGGDPGRGRRRHDRPPPGRRAFDDGLQGGRQGG